MATTQTSVPVNLNVDVISRVVTRLATSPVLRYFAGPGTQLLSDILSIADQVGISQDTYDIMATHATEGRNFKTLIVAELKQFNRHFAEVVEEDGSFHPNTQALANSLRVLMDEA